MRLTCQHGLRPGFAKLKNMWIEHQRHKRANLAIGDLPDSLLRDAGLEHLITDDHNARSLNRWL